MKYGGSFMKGVSSGISGMLPAVMNMQEIKWKKQAEKDLKQAEEDAKTAINELITNPANQEYLSSGISADPYSPIGIQLTTSLLGLNADMGKYIADIQKATYEGNHKEQERLLEEFKIRVDAIKELNLEGMSVNPDFGFNISSPEGLKILNMQKTYKETPKETMPYAMTKEMAGVAGFKDMPEAMPTGEKDLSEIEKKMNYANMLNLDVEAKAKILGGGDSTFQQEIEAYYAAGGTDEGFRKRFERGAGIDINIPPSIGAVKSAAQMFEGAYTEEAWNSALFYNEQAKDKITPPHESSWENRLTAITKEMASALKKFLNEKGKLKNAEFKDKYETRVDTYMKYIEEIQAKFPDIDLSQFPKFIKQGQIAGIEYPWSTKLIDEKGW